MAARFSQKPCRKDEMNRPDGTVEEHAWAFERQASITLIDKVRELFKADGRLARAIDAIEQLADRASGVFMANPNTDRGPRDYPEDEDDVSRLMRIASREAARAAVEIKYYSEGGGGGDKSWKNWMMTLCGGLALSGIAGGVLMYGKLSAIETSQINQADQIRDLRQEVIELRQVFRNRP
jgi:hypothetical protein